MSNYQTVFCDKCGGFISGPWAGSCEPRRCCCQSPTQERIGDLELELAALRVLAADVLPVLDALTATGCKHQWGWDAKGSRQVWLDKPCGQCNNCRAAAAAEKIRKGLAK